MTNGAAREMLATRVLLDERLKTLEDLPQGFAQVLRHRKRKVGLTSFDWTIGWACQELGIPIVAHPEIRSTWQRRRTQVKDGFSVIHPHNWPE